MNNIRSLPNGVLELIVDKTIYDDWVIEKVLYWWTKDYLISRQNSEDLRNQIIKLEPKNKCLLSFQEVKEKISNDFIDYKNRQTIAKETSNLRDLIFAKAFANNDDFVEFTFKD